MRENFGVSFSRARYCGNEFISNLGDLATFGKAIGSITAMHILPHRRRMCSSRRDTLSRALITADIHLPMYQRCSIRFKYRMRVAVVDTTLLAKFQF